MSSREEKKARFAGEQNKNRLPVIVVAILTLAVVSAGAFWFIANPVEATSYVRADNGKITIPASEVNDGMAHYFKYKSGDQSVSFFVLKSSDGEFRAALDACDVCYRSLKGYRQEGDFMVCNNCNQRFESSMINVVKGGCNPAPLTRIVVGEKIVLNEKELIDGRRYFPTNG